MKQRKMVAQVTKETIDEDGVLQIVETEKTFVQKIDTEKFYMCFFEKMSSFYGIKHLSDMKLMVAMCELAEFNSGIVCMTQKTRTKLSEKAGISISNISKNLKRLVDIQLISYDAGDYQINPEVFWKGETKVRRELLMLGELKFNITIVGESSAIQPSKQFE